MPDEKEELLEAGAAAQYLAHKWGIPNYTTDAFKMHRARHGLQPDFRAQNATFWYRSTLDKLPKPGGRRRQRDDQDEPDHLPAVAAV